MTYTAKQKAQEAKREVGYRQWVYSRKVAEGSMKANDAEHRIALMQEIEADYLALAEKEEEKWSLPLTSPDKNSGD